MEQGSVWYKGVRIFNEITSNYNTNCNNINEFKKSALNFVKERITTV